MCAEERLAPSNSVMCANERLAPSNSVMCAKERLAPSDKNKKIEYEYNRAQINEDNSITKAVEEEPFLNNERIITTRTPVKNDSYAGARGRPHDSLEAIFVNTKMTPVQPGNPCKKYTAARKIQRIQKYWTAPKLRARNYSPEHPTAQKGALRAPGAVRLPGYELSSREGVALTYLIEHGRLAELERSLEQLQERGAVLTESTFIMLITQCYKIGEASMAGAVLSYAIKADIWLSDRSYSTVILAHLEAGSIELAEAVTKMALNNRLLPGQKALTALAEAGLYTASIWRARWRLQLLKHAQIKDVPLPLEKAAIVVVTGTSPNRKVLSGHTAVLGWEQYDHTPTTTELLDFNQISSALIKRLEATHGMLMNKAKTKLTEILNESPEGHDAVQLDLPQVPNPKEDAWLNADILLSPRVCWLEPRIPCETKSKRVHLRLWVIQVNAEEQLFQDEKRLRWIPADEAVWQVSRLDALGLICDSMITVLNLDRARNQWPNKSSQITGVTKARVLIGCEESLVVNTRLGRRGLIVPISVDLVPPEHGGHRHLVRDVSSILMLGSWHGLIAFPPCTYLALCAGLYAPRPGRREKMKRAAEFFKQLYEADIPLIALENPKQNSEARQLIQIAPSQCIEPWAFNENLSKPTSLFLRGGLPRLVGTKNSGIRLRVFTSLTPSPLRSMVRGRTFNGIAQAMVDQWSPLFVTCANKDSNHALPLTIAVVRPSEHGVKENNTDKQGTPEEVNTMVDMWRRHFPDPKPAKECDERTKIAINTACKVIETEINADPVHLIFKMWRRETELKRGRLFGTTGPAGNIRSRVEGTPQQSHVLRLMASQLLREHRAMRRDDLEMKGEHVALRPLPIPPIRRLIKRAGKWWAWVPKKTDIEEEYKYLWRKIPEESQELLDEMSEVMRPTVAALCIHPVRAKLYTIDELRVRSDWNRLSSKVRKGHLATQGTRLASSLKESCDLPSRLAQEVQRTLERCLDCGLLRDAVGGCPRGLGATSCKVHQASVPLDKGNNSEAPRY